MLIGIRMSTVAGDYESQEKTELEKCHDFIAYSHDKIGKYNNAMEVIYSNMQAELKNINLNSTRAMDIYTLKTIKKKCSEALFWVTKSNELLAVLSNHCKLAKYSESDMETYKNSTQKLYITDKINFQNEYSINDVMANTSISIMNLGYDENRDVDITIEIINADLGINISKQISAVFTCPRMENILVNLPDIETPTQQCRANCVIKITNRSGETILKETIKEIFFRKESN